MAKFHMRVEARTPDNVEGKLTHVVRYTMPGIDFSCVTNVTEDIAKLLAIAIEHGKNEGKKEIREALGLR